MRTCGIHPQAKPETSRFPCKKLPHMPVSLTTPGWRALAITRPSMLPSVRPTTSAPETFKLSRLHNWPMRSPLPLSAISGQRLFATHVQLDEIDKTPCERTRAQLRVAFEEIAAENLPTESAVWDVSRWNQAKWPAGDSLFKAMLACLKALDKAGEKRHLNQLRDILIAETAIRNGLILVSGDPKLRTVAIKCGGRAIDREQFRQVAGASL
jgi:hypothetical protein